MELNLKNKDFNEYSLREIERKLQIKNSDLLYNSAVLLTNNKHVSRKVTNAQDLFNDKFQIRQSGEDAYHEGYYVELADIEQNKFDERNIQIEVAQSTLATNQATRDAVNENTNSIIFQKGISKFTVGIAIITLLALVVQVEIASKSVTSSDIEKLKSAVTEHNKAEQSQIQSLKNLVNFFEHKKVDTVFLKK